MKTMLYDMDSCDELIPMPKEIILHNGCNEPCDALCGPCCCGSYHDVQGVRELCKDKGIYCEKLERVLEREVLKVRTEKALSIILRVK